MSVYLNKLAGAQTSQNINLSVEASLDRQPSNEGSFFRPAGREKAGDESGGNKPAYVATNTINKIAP